jgi:hypothetical protein
LPCSAYLTRQIAYHRADLASNLSPLNPLFQERYQAIASGLAAQNPSCTMPARALAVLGHRLPTSGHAGQRARCRCFVSFICVVPACSCFGKPKPIGAGATADAH